MKLEFIKCIAEQTWPSFPNAVDNAGWLSVDEVSVIWNSDQWLYINHWACSMVIIVPTNKHGLLRDSTSNPLFQELGQSIE